MKKTMAICLAGVMGLAFLGLAACGDDAGGTVSGTETDPGSLVSDKIKSDEQWDQAMWNTVTRLFDFEGEDDPTKVYEKAPYWYPSIQYDNDVEIAMDSNFKIEYSRDFTSSVDENGLPTSKPQYERSKYTITSDDGKFYATYDHDADYFDDGERCIEAMSAEEYMQSINYEDYEEGMPPPPFYDMRAQYALRYTRAVNYYDEQENPVKVGVWQILPELNSMTALEEANMFFFVSHFGTWKAHGNNFFETHNASILDYAKYDEEKKGYVISDSELIASIFGLDSSEVDMQFVYKFKDGMLRAVEREEKQKITLGPVLVPQPTMKTTLALTYGGQKVTFPEDLPWYTSPSEED